MTIGYDGIELMRLAWTLPVLVSIATCNPPAPSVGTVPALEPAWKKLGADHAGMCCARSEECGGLPCEPYRHAYPGCTNVCVLHCTKNEVCPSVTPAFPEPVPCPSDGQCPIGAAGA